METQKIKTAIVLLNWNGRNWLEKFLPTLLEYSVGATVFVVDNCSTDDSILFLNKNFPNVNVIINESNGGYAKGYNDALSKISAEYFVLINSDVEVTSGWLSPIIDLMDSDISISACQPKVLSYSDKTRFEYAGAAGGFIDILGYPFCRGRIFDATELDRGQYDDVVEVFWATGACLFLRACHFWKIGGLDEDFFAHQEEIDLCWRMQNQGYKIMVEPRSIVYHVGGGTLNALSPSKTYLNFRNNLFMLVKNLPLKLIFFVIPLRLFLDGLAAFSFLMNKNGIRHFSAVLKAHFAFYVLLPKMLIKRRGINQKNNVKGVMKGSLLVKHKIYKIDSFSEL